MYGCTLLSDEFEPHRMFRTGSFKGCRSRDQVDLLNILQSVTPAGAGLRLLDEPFVETNSEMGELIVFLIGWATRRQEHEYWRTRPMDGR